MNDVLSSTEAYNELQKMKDLLEESEVSIIIGFQSEDGYHISSYVFNFEEIEIDLENLEFTASFEDYPFDEGDYIIFEDRATFSFNNITGLFDCNEHSYYDVFLSRQQFELFWVKRNIALFDELINKYEAKKKKEIDNYNKKFGHTHKLR